jgi:hypothetical protein
VPSSKSKNGVDLRKHETEMEQLQGQRLVPDNHMPKQKPIRHYRTIRSACLGCAKPVHLVRMSDGTYEWQHDGVPTAEMMERHRKRGVGRQPVCTGRALEMIAKAGEEDHE